MNSRDENEKILESLTAGNLESPFRGEESFAREQGDEWELQIVKLQNESPFQHVFEEGISNVDDEHQTQDDFSDDEPSLFESEDDLLNTLSPSELKATRITSTFETGRAGSYGGLTGNGDGQGVSFGLLNFAWGPGGLIKRLTEFLSNYPAVFSEVFASDADRFRDILLATKPDPKHPKLQVRDKDRQMEFAIKVLNDANNKIREPWKTYFGRLENNPEFRSIQVKGVRDTAKRARYWCKYFGLKTERAFVFMFDLVSSHGGSWLSARKFNGVRKKLLRAMLEKKKAEVGRTNLTELEKLSVISNMIADVSADEYRKKARVRKLWFVNGRGKVHGTFYDLAIDFGVTDALPDFDSNQAIKLGEPSGEWEQDETEDFLPYPNEYRYDNASQKCLPGSFELEENQLSVEATSADEESAWSDDGAPQPDHAYKEEVVEEAFPAPIVDAEQERGTEYRAQVRPYDPYSFYEGDSSAYFENQSAAQTPSASWAAVTDSPDHRHLLPELLSNLPFSFTPSNLERLCTLNRFQLPKDADRVLFGLRACTLTGDFLSSAWTTSAELVEVLPDHVEARCVLGVWDRRGGRIMVFKGSTVPYWRSMKNYRLGGDPCNLLSTGLYEYRIGTHKAGNRLEIKGAFKQRGPVVVLRTVDDLSYTVTDRWDHGHVGDNIHPARHAGTTPFSSEGCLTVPGEYDRATEMHSGLWANFRAAAGLTSKSARASENGRRFPFVLLTGRDARLIGEVADTTVALSRLRFGSRGTDVRALQQGLRSTGHYSAGATGVMDADTTLAYIRWQKSVDGDRADAIVTPEDGRALGFDMIRQQSITPVPWRRRGMSIRGITVASESPTTAHSPFVLRGSVGRGGKNVVADVAALKDRLIGLGYNWVTRGRTIDPATIHAIKLFQSIIAGRNSLRGDGLVRVPGRTYEWLQAVNAPCWQTMPLGSASEGFYNAELVNTTDNHDYGTHWLADVIRAAGAHYRDNYLNLHGSAALLTVNDVSLPRGGDTDDHAGHETGLACDLQLPRLNGTAGGITWKDKAYDRDAARGVIHALRAQPLVSRVYFNDSVLIREGLCKRLDGHHDHIHFEIKPPMRVADDLSAGVSEFYATEEELEAESSLDEWGEAEESSPFQETGSDEAFLSDDEGSLEQDEISSDLEQPDSVADPSAIRDLLLAVPVLAFTADKRSKVGKPLLKPTESKTAIGWNAKKHPGESGINPDDILLALENYVDLSAIKNALVADNAQTLKYSINLNRGTQSVDAVFVEAIHQFQMKCYKSTDPKLHGHAEESVLDSLGFWPRSGLHTKALYNKASDKLVSYKKSEIQKAIDGVSPYAVMPTDLRQGLSAENWWGSFVNPCFLGWTFNRPIHVYFARKLRKAELWLLSQPQFSGNTPVELAQLLRIREQHKGGRDNEALRPGAHTVGLSMDINYEGNPHIGDGRKPTAVKHFTDVMKKAVSRISGLALAEKSFTEYLNKLGTDTSKTTAQIYDDLSRRDQDLREYLKRAEAQEDIKLFYDSPSVFIGPGGPRDPRKGFLNLDKDLVLALRDQAGLSWGAVDFGSNESGDIMHFDCRLDGIGRAVLCKTGAKFNANHPFWKGMAGLPCPEIKRQKPPMNNEVMDFEYEDDYPTAEESSTELDETWEEQSAEHCADERADTEGPDEFNGDSYETEEDEDELIEAEAPLLLKKTSPAADPAGETLLVQISLGKHKSLLCPNKSPCPQKKWYGIPPVTGIFIPDNYVPQSMVDIILYLHGHKNGNPGSNVIISTYWDKNKYPYFGLREEINASKRNVILVAPTLGYHSEAGDLVLNNGLNDYLEKVLEALRTYGPFKSHSLGIENIGNLILAAHSGGGAVMRKLATSSDDVASKTKECWGFDSLYNKVDVEPWRRWAIANSKIRNFYSYYFSDLPTLYSKRLEKDKPSNIHVIPARVKDHFELILPCLRERLAGADFLGRTQ